MTVLKAAHTVRWWAVFYCLPRLRALSYAWGIFPDLLFRNFIATEFFTLRGEVLLCCRWESYLFFFFFKDKTAHHELQDGSYASHYLKTSLQLFEWIIDELNAHLAPSCEIKRSPSILVESESSLTFATSTLLTFIHFNPQFYYIKFMY